MRSLYEPTHALALQKQRHTPARTLKSSSAVSPFLCIGTQGNEGRADVSPGVDAAGFVRILDDSTLAIPDRPGNNKARYARQYHGQSIGRAAVSDPGYDETLRVNGRARLTTQRDLLEEMAVGERLPKLAIVVEVDEVFLHCAKAFRRSHLWDPGSRQDRSERCRP